MNSAHGKNMMSALLQTPHGFPRYRSDRIDSSSEKETSLRKKPGIFALTQRIYRCGGLHVLKGGPVDSPYELGAWRKYYKRSLSNTPRDSEVSS